MREATGISALKRVLVVDKREEDGRGGLTVGSERSLSTYLYSTVIHVSTPPFKLRDTVRNVLNFLR